MSNETQNNTETAAWTSALRIPFRTERLLIRPFLPEDGDALYQYLSDPTVIRYEPYEPFSHEDACREANRRAEDPCFFAVCLPPSAGAPYGSLIGSLYFAPCDFFGAELGYVFSRAYWHKGYATEACRILLNKAFAAGCHRIVAMCNPDNTASWRLMERLGMRREGQLQKNIYFQVDAYGLPIWQDTYLYAMLKEEWEKIPQGCE